MEELDKQIKQLAKANGLGMIKTKITEECNELIEALEENDEQHIVEEIADVFITMMQYVIHKGLQDEFLTIRELKINRTYERLGIKK